MNLLRGRGPLIATYVLVLTPLMTLFLYWRQERPVAADHRLGARERQFRDLLSLAEYRAHHRQRFFRLASRSFGLLQQAGFAPTHRERVLSRLVGSFPMELAVFPPANAPGTGAMWSPSWAPVRSRYLWQRFFADLKSRQIPRDRLKAYRQLFGVGFNEEILDWEGRPFTCVRPQGDSYIYWRQGPNGSGVIFFSPRGNDPLEPWRWWFKSEPQPGWEFWACDVPTRKWVGRRPLDDSLRQFLRRALITPGFRASDDRHVMFSSLLPGDVLILGRCRNEEAGQVGREYFSLALLILMVPVLWWQAPRWGLSSLRLFPRFLVFLGIVMTVPLIQIGFVGFKVFNDQISRLETNLHERHLDLLRTAETVAAKRFQHLSETYEQISDEIVRAPHDYDHHRHLISKHLASGSFDGFRLSDRNGRLIAEHSKISSFRELELLFLRQMLTRFVERRLPDVTGPNKEIVALFQSSNLGFCVMSDYPGRVSFLDADGPTGGIYYWRTIPARTATDAAVVGFGLSTQGLRRKTLTDLASGVWVFDSDQSRWHPEFPLIRGLDAVLGKVLATNRSESRVLVGEGGPVIVTAYPCATQHLRKVLLVTSSPITELTEARRRAQLLAGVILGSGVLMVLLLAHLVARLLLNRVRDLTEGVAALERGDLDHSLPATEQDELGELSQAFNGMMQELHEIDRAARVQESLIPAHPPVIPGYEIALRYIPLAGLAGDYADAIVGPTGWWCFAIGDVTGHGVGASFLSAMAKILIQSGVRDGLSLAETIARANQVLMEAGGKRQVMSFFGLLLDPQTGDLECISAGQPFPYLRFGDGTWRQIGRQAKPLGFSTRKPYPSFPEQLPREAP
jgi:HAMP domain-containing protein